VSGLHALRAGEWGVQMLLLAIVAAVYYGTIDAGVAAYAAAVSRVALWTVFLLAGMYVFNDYCDRRADAHKPSFPRDAAAHPRRTLILAVALSTAGLALAGVLAPRPAVRILAGAQLLAGIAYSAPPVRLKERGWWGVLTAALVQRIPTFWMVVLAFPVSAAAAWTLTAWLAVAGLLFILEHQIEDLDADAAAGVRTLAAALGRERARRLVTRCYRAFVPVTAAAAAIIAFAGGFVAGGVILAAAGTLLLVLLRRRYASGTDLAPHRAVVAEHGGSRGNGAVA
jgi:chlorophyll synthase